MGKTINQTQENKNESFFNITDKDKTISKNLFSGIDSLIKANLSSEGFDSNNSFGLPQFSKTIRIYNAEKYQVAPGQEIIINGQGFEKTGN